MQAPTGRSMPQRSKIATFGGGLSSMPQRPFPPLSSYFVRDTAIVVAMKFFFVRCIHPTELYLSLTAS